MDSQAATQAAGAQYDRERGASTSALRAQPACRQAGAARLSTLPAAWPARSVRRHSAGIPDQLQVRSGRPDCAQICGSSGAWAVSPRHLHGQRLGAVHATRPPRAPSALQPVPVAHANLQQDIADRTVRTLEVYLDDLQEVGGQATRAGDCSRGCTRCGCGPLLHAPQHIHTDTTCTWIRRSTWRPRRMSRGLWPPSWTTPCRCLVPPAAARCRRGCGLLVCTRHGHMREPGGCSPPPQLVAPCPSHALKPAGRAGPSPPHPPASLRAPTARVPCSTWAWWGRRPTQSCRPPPTPTTTQTCLTSC